jgi:hypothetical protein
MRRIGILVVAILAFAMCSKAQSLAGVLPADSNPVQVGIGFTFLSFHEVPSDTVNNPGFTFSALYRQNRLGIEGEVTDIIGAPPTGSKSHSQFVFAGGGFRLYLPDVRSAHPFAEAEVGVAALTPAVTLGNSTSPGYKLAAGLDFNPLHSRIQYRVSAGIIGSTMFNTYQISPVASVSLVIPINPEY